MKRRVPISNFLVDDCLTQFLVDGIAGGGDKLKKVDKYLNHPDTIRDLVNTLCCSVTTKNCALLTHRAYQLLSKKSLHDNIMNDKNSSSLGLSLLLEKVTLTSSCDARNDKKLIQPSPMCQDGTVLPLEELPNTIYYFFSTISILVNEKPVLFLNQMSQLSLESTEQFLQYIGEDPSVKIFCAELIANAAISNVLHQNYILEVFIPKLFSQIKTVSEFHSITHKLIDYGVECQTSKAFAFFFRTMIISRLSDILNSLLDPGTVSDAFNLLQDIVYHSNGYFETMEILKTELAKHPACIKLLINSPIKRLNYAGLAITHFLLLGGDTVIANFVLESVIEFFFSIPKNPVSLIKSKQILIKMTQMDITFLDTFKILERIGNIYHQHNNEINNNFDFWMNVNSLLKSIPNNLKNPSILEIEKYYQKNEDLSDSCFKIDPDLLTKHKNSSVFSSGKFFIKKQQK